MTQPDVTASTFQSGCSHDSFDTETSGIVRTRQVRDDNLRVPLPVADNVGRRAQGVNRLMRACARPAS